jgi:FAD/FMN-containing dehydrogenase
VSLAPAHPGASVQAQAPEPLSQEVIAHLTAIVGPGGVITNPSALLVYESDGLMSYRVRPRALIAPRSTEQVSAVLRSLAHLGIPFVPRGAGTGLSGGALALERAVLLSLARMDRILSIDPVSRIARVEPGVVNVKLTAAARPHGLYYAPDPSSQTVCTIGGNVAENAGGPHCLKHGVTLNHIAGATVVLSDGSVVRLGGAAGETVGYDLLGLFIGSEGTFGVATELEVRLARVPEFVATLLALFDDINDASRAVTSIIADGLLPAALEMVDREAIRAVEASIYAAGLPTDVAGALVIEFDGTPAAVHADARRAVSLCEQNRARSVRLATDEA